MQKPNTPGIVSQVTSVSLTTSFLGSMLLFGVIVFHSKSYMYSKLGIKVLEMKIESVISSFTILFLQVCEPYWGSKYLQICCYCLFYFVPTLSLMYCYGSIFHIRHSSSNGILNKGKEMQREIHSQGRTQIVLQDDFQKKRYSDSFFL